MFFAARIAEYLRREVPGTGQTWKSRVHHRLQNHQRNQKSISRHLAVRIAESLMYAFYFLSFGSFEFWHIQRAPQTEIEVWHSARN